jgi:hypothetical protein
MLRIRNPNYMCSVRRIIIECKEAYARPAVSEISLPSSFPPPLAFFPFHCLRPAESPTATPPCVPGAGVVRESTSYLFFCRYFRGIFCLTVPIKCSRLSNWIHHVPFPRNSKPQWPHHRSSWLGFHAEANQPECGHCAKKQCDSPSIKSQLRLPCCLCLGRLLAGPCQSLPGLRIKQACATPPVRHNVAGLNCGLAVMS